MLRIYSSRGKRPMSRPSLPAVQLRTRTLGVRLKNRHEWDTLVARAAAAGVNTDPSERITR